MTVLDKDNDLYHHGETGSAARWMDIVIEGEYTHRLFRMKQTTATSSSTTQEKQHHLYDKIKNMFL